jgi:hypothetical protein
MEGSDNMRLGMRNLSARMKRAYKFLHLGVWKTDGCRNQNGVQGKAVIRYR